MAGYGYRYGNKTIKIMHVLDSLDIGGLENGLVNLINNMNSPRFGHAVCCIRQSGRSRERFNKKDIEIFVINKGDRRKLFLSLELASLFKRMNIDIVHTRNWGAIDGVIGAKLAGVPIVIHGEHGRDVTDPDGTNKKKNLIRKVFGRVVDRYVTVSENLREWLIQVVGLDGHKIDTICNGVDTIRFNPDNKAASRAKYGYGSETTIVGTVGRLDPVKDQGLLIRAFAQVRAEYPELVLLIIGDGPCRRNLESLSEDLGLSGKAFFLGMRDDIPELLKTMDIFVLPSIAEGMSNTILEAMAAGVPVIATRVGGNSELVEETETGILVPPHDPVAMAEAIHSYLKDPAKLRRHGEGGRRRVEQHFTMEKMVKGYMEVYDSVLNRRGDSRTED